MTMATTRQCQEQQRRQPYGKSKQQRRMTFSVAPQCHLIGHVMMMMLVLLVTSLSSSAAAAVDDNFKPASWYERYDSYPPYCASPIEMQSRKIPPLQNQQQEQQQQPQPPSQLQNLTGNTTTEHVPPPSTSIPLLGETRLVHVTAVLRHGARTPWASASKLKCWNGFWESPETGVWDCDLTTILAPPNPNHVKEEEGDTTVPTTSTQDKDAMFLFEKKYDALIPHPAEGEDSASTTMPFANELNGTCQVGQLLLQGYEQELQNGQFLRDAYFYDSTQKFNHDERMRLLDVSFTEYTPWAPNQVRFRADDEQRTLMSGQVVLRGMLGPEVIHEFEQTGVYPTIPVHTADYERDYLSPNHEICPKLNTLKEVAQQSSLYQRFNYSLETRGIREYMSRQLGSSQVEMDCLYTTMCTDRPLPPAIDDYTNSGDKKSWFRAISEYQAQKENLLVMYNDAGR
jgi:hypothetical protein